MNFRDRGPHGNEVDDGHGGAEAPHAVHTQRPAQAAVRARRARFS